MKGDWSFTTIYELTNSYGSFLCVQDVPSVVIFTYEVKDDKITLNWKEPNNNGAAITLYTVYYGTITDEQWKEVKDIADVSTRKYVFRVKIGKKYKVLVTASNKYGESSKEGLIHQVDVPEGEFSLFLTVCARKYRSLHRWPKLSV